jgi:hypothetical protein
MNSKFSLGREVLRTLPTKLHIVTIILRSSISILYVSTGMGVEQ